MERASVRFASRCSNESSARPHHCASFVKRCAMTQSNRPSAATTARKSHVRAPRAQTRNWRS
eukprot:1628709-Lingulodinium_polyedra.AAC.1